jgi:protein disulfide-isomerase A6
MPRLLISLLLLGLIAQGAQALYSASSPVIQLTADNFESKIKKGGVWIVEFYAPW